MNLLAVAMAVALAAVDVADQAQERQPVEDRAGVPVDERQCVPVAPGTCGLLDEQGRIVAAWPAGDDGSCWREEGR